MQAFRRSLQRLLFSIGADLLFLVAFIAVLAIICAIYGATPHLVHGSTYLPLVVMAVLIAVAFGARLRGILSGDRRQQVEFLRLALTMLRDWSPLILIIVVYDNFHDLTRVIRPHVVDDTLRQLDESLLGIEPALWAQRITRPWLTEYMTFSYALFFVFPTLVLAITYARGEFFAFREFGLALSLAYYLGLVGYMTVPAVGPRFAMANEFTTPLVGYWLTEPARVAWNSIESVDRDCFPSLHTAMSTISLVYLWRLRRGWGRFGRVLFAVSAPLVVSLWASTLYLRYHYAVDVLAGWALALFCTRAAPALRRWYYGLSAVRPLGHAMGLPTASLVTTSSTPAS
jgi:membrane-associated phospholipid phosphatase